MKFNFEQIKVFDRDKIIELALKELSEKGIKVNPPEVMEYAQIKRSPEDITVILKPVFFITTEYGRRYIKKDDLKVVFSKQKILVKDSSAGMAPLGHDDKVMVDKVLKRKKLSAGENLSIEFINNRLEVQATRGLEGGTERYWVDDEGEWHMIWHEHPMPEEFWRSRKSK